MAPTASCTACPNPAPTPEGHSLLRWLLPGHVLIQNIRTGKVRTLFAVQAPVSRLEIAGPGRIIYDSLLQRNSLKEFPSAQASLPTDVGSRAVTALTVSLTTPRRPVRHLLFFAQWRRRFWEVSTSSVSAPYTQAIVRLRWSTPPITSRHEATGSIARTLVCRRAWTAALPSQLGIISVSDSDELRANAVSRVTKADPDRPGMVSRRRRRASCS